MHLTKDKLWMLYTFYWNEAKHIYLLIQIRENILGFSALSSKQIALRYWKNGRGVTTGSKNQLGKIQFANSNIHRSHRMNTHIPLTQPILRSSGSKLSPIFVHTPSAVKRRPYKSSFLLIPPILTFCMQKWCRLNFSLQYSPEAGMPVFQLTIENECTVISWP